MWDKVKSAALWVWNWITVLVATIMGLMSTAVQYLDQITGLDWSQVVSKERAVAVVFWTGVLKAIVAAYQAQKAKT
ncbi:hypothetical protein [Bradyrhizobium sp. 930_D9_N1_4]|uniref:hypothetical protein n=1 Tax=Bradyrhizobium sp. 930_D9_N1_4 TaxID=3240374 RepID=UPI003F89EDCC